MSSPGAGPVIPLLPRRRIAALPYGTMRSRRRGVGVDLVGARPYRPGDDVRRIDHRSSARRATEESLDQLVVREFLTEEATRVIIVVDRGPSLDLFPDGLPWLSKPRAVAEAARVIVDSAKAARCPVGFVDDATWKAPDGRTKPETILAEHVAARGPIMPSGSVERSLETLLALERSLAPGTLVFLLSDFLTLPRRNPVAAALGRGWDVVPVVVQDPTWEQSFPPVGGTSIPVTDPATGRTRLVRLTSAEAAARRAANEARLGAMLEAFAELDLDYVLISQHTPERVHAAFAAWAGGRRAGARTL